MPPTRDSTAFTASLLPPPGANQKLILPTRTIPFPTANPPVFNDALAVRFEVFVDEQKCPPEFEIDEDDSRSWHWVIHDTEAAKPGAQEAEIEPKTIKLPVGTLRLVPPPHASHESFVAVYAPGTSDTGRDITADGYDLEHEPYIKFGRVAVLAAYRGCGLARRLMETAMAWAEENAGEINESFLEIYKRKGGDPSKAPLWKGLTLVHAQVDVEKFYERLGFVTDESLGRWVEEGIEHVGMWMRLNVKS
ncbi:acyl-CoA N-acyltransferase [Aspergillus tetrazonus]